VALAWEYLTTYGPERSAFAVRHALEAAKAVDFPIQTFGGAKSFLPQALAAWEKRAGAEEARREADARVDNQSRRERAERERRRRLADMHALLSDAELAALKRRAEETLAADRVARTRLGYDVLVKLKADDLLEQESVPMPVRADGAHPPAAVTARR
jgi:Asp-tRNA(Asn)/Glu-tRNA(Gln) amidotransferase A subunit family amidase